MTISFDEDFEGDLTRFDSLMQNLGVVTTDSTAALFGSKGLKGVVSPNGVVGARACAVKLVNATTLHIRGYFKIPVGLPEGGLSLISVINSGGDASPGVVRFRNINGVNKLDATYQNWDAVNLRWVYVNLSTTSDVLLDPARTYLIEMRIVIGTVGQLKVWVDEQVVIDVALDNSKHTGMSTVRTGLVYASSTGDTTVYHDEFALGDAYIGPVSTPPPINPWLIAGIAGASIIGIIALIYMMKK